MSVTQRSRPAFRRPEKFRPGVEFLEDRALPSAAPATHLEVILPTHVRVGHHAAVRVIALDAANHRVNNYAGTIQFASSDSATAVPADYTFKHRDHGKHTFTITPQTAGSLTITATDKATATITGSATTTVDPQPLATHFLVLAPHKAQTGAAVPLVVVALDASNHLVKNYTGTVTFTGGGTGATLPADYTFTAADKGSHKFTVTFATAGSDTVTATDKATSSIMGSATVAVSAPPAATHFLVLAPHKAFTGQPTTFFVVALDDSNHRVKGYTGTVTFSGGGAGATLPADYTFTAADKGVHKFTATFATAGSDTITAADTATASITGSATVAVSLAPVATHFDVIAPHKAVTGQATPFYVVALDASNHRVKGYTGTVTFTGGGTGATLPADYTFTTADKGIHKFTATFATAGSDTITATDTATASINGSATVTVSAPAVATQLVVYSAHDFARSGTSFQVAVVAYDADHHLVKNYTGTVHFTGGGAGATLPADYTFTAGDKGVHVFTVTLTAQGLDTITVTDNSTPPLTGAVNVNVFAPKHH